MMRLKKVILSLFLPLLIMTFGCSKKDLTEWMQPNGKVKVLSTTAQVGNLVTAVGGSRVDGWVLIQGDLDPHSYEIVKGDMEKLNRADLIFYNGLGLEHGAALSSILQNSPNSLAIGEMITKNRPHDVLMRGTVVDPHIWMDISLWQEGVTPIVQALSEKDPEGAPYYKAQGEALMKHLEASHNELYALMQTIPPEKRYLVTSHDAFQYFTRAYLASPGEENWQMRFAAPEGLAPEGQLSPKDIQKIIDFLKEKNITVIFPESNVSKDSLRKIALAGKELGLDIRICTTPLYGDSMGGLTYLEMMRHDGKTIAEHL